MSFLCDRTTTNITKSQPGFLNFIVIPLFTVISEVTPNMKELENNARSNMVSWENYEETEEQKKIYKLRDEEAFKKRWGKIQVADIQDEEDCTTTPVELPNIDI